MAPAKLAVACGAGPPFIPPIAAEKPARGVTGEAANSGNRRLDIADFRFLAGVASTSFATTLLNWMTPVDATASGCTQFAGFSTCPDSKLTEHGALATAA